MNIPLLIGAILGLTSIMMAAFADHSLASHLTSYSFNLVTKAVKYHETYAVVITMISLLIPLQYDYRVKSWLVRSAFLFIAGVIIFSGSLYFAAIFSSHDIVAFTPYGGMLLMLGWLGLIRSSLFKLA